MPAIHFRPVFAAVAALVALIGLSLSGCVTVDYLRLPPGHFTGSVFVMWVGEGNQSGDGNFLFVPDPRDPLIFTRADPQSHGAVIKPGLMYTDGGSIPKIAQVFNGFSPWGYAPAYMIHDWLFVGRHCLVDGEPGSRFDQIRDVDFEDSAAILGEAIQALVVSNQVKPNDVAGQTITGAVDSIVARNLWDERGACAASAVSAKDRAAAEAAIPGSTTMLRRRNLNIEAFELPPETPRAPPARPAKIVSHVTFGH
jgi:hypothetical protein